MKYSDIVKQLAESILYENVISPNTLKGLINKHKISDKDIAVDNKNNKVIVKSKSPKSFYDDLIRSNKNLKSKVSLENGNVIIVMESIQEGIASKLGKAVGVAALFLALTGTAKAEDVDTTPDKPNAPHTQTIKKKDGSKEHVYQNQKGLSQDQKEKEKDRMKRKSKEKISAS